MDLTIETITGPQGYRNSDGARLKYRGGTTAEMVGSPLNGRYAEQAARGNSFTVANTGSTALSMGNSNATGLILTNPTGSGKNLALLEVCVDQVMVPGGAAPLMIAWANGSAFANPNATAALVIKPATMGQTTAATVAIASTGCWIPNSTPVRAIGGGPVAGSSINTAPIKDDVGGALVVTPGNSILLQSFTTQIGVVASYTWSEIPV